MRGDCRGGICVVEDIVWLRLVALIGEINILVVFDAVARRPEDEGWEISTGFFSIDSMDPCAQHSGLRMQ
jgi:hypothetical protein